MRNLIMFSSFFSDDYLKEEVVHMAPKGKDSKVVIIPSFSEFRPVEEMSKYHIFKDLGFNNIVMYDVCFFFDENCDISDADVIFLGGGNTWLFRFLLKKHNMFSFLQNFVANGGLLIGESAGSIMMCDKIDIAKFADEDIVGDRACDGLGVFHDIVKPHSQSWYHEFDKFLDFSNLYPDKRLYMIEDGMCLIVKDDDISFYGKDYYPFVIKEGKACYDFEI